MVAGLSHREVPVIVGIAVRIAVRSAVPARLLCAIGVPYGATVNAAKKQLAWKALSAGAAAIAVLVTRRVVTAGWQQVRGEPPPEGVTDRKVTWRTALVYAVAMGVGIAVAQVLAARFSARAWEVATHEAPPDSE